MSNTIGPMKSLTIELPHETCGTVEAEAVEGKPSISDVVRKHLRLSDSNNPRSALGEAITDVVRSAVTDPLPMPSGRVRTPYLTQS